jgi:hypothetical protein
MEPIEIELRNFLQEIIFGVRSPAYCFGSHEDYIFLKNHGFLSQVYKIEVELTTSSSTASIVQRIVHENIEKFLMPIHSMCNFSYITQDELKHDGAGAWFSPERLTRWSHS